MPVCWLGWGTVPKTTFLPKGTHAFLMKTTGEAGPLLASSPCSLFWGKLPTTVWFNLTDCPLSSRCFKCGWSCQWLGKGRQERTHTIVAHNPLVTWKSRQGRQRSFIFIWAIARTDLRPLSTGAGNPKTPQSKGS